MNRVETIWTVDTGSARAVETFPDCASNQNEFRPQCTGVEHKAFNATATHEGPHEKRSALHDFEPIPDLLSLTGNEWTPHTDTTHP